MSADEREDATPANLATGRVEEDVLTVANGDLLVEARSDDHALDVVSITRR
jgi:hypothetical protein